MICVRNFQSANIAGSKILWKGIKSERTRNGGRNQVKHFKCQAEFTFDPGIKREPLELIGESGVTWSYIWFRKPRY